MGSKDILKPEEYTRTLQRAKKLEARIKQKQKDNPEEHQTALRLLQRIKKKLEEYRRLHNLPEEEAVTVENLSEKKESQWGYSDDDTAMDDFGILYSIFGKSYTTTVNYHNYKVVFIRPAEKGLAFYRVVVDIYEDDILICKGATIGFWPWNLGDDNVKDMEFSTMSEKAILKYDCLHIYQKISNEMGDIWNYYFETTILLETTSQETTPEVIMDAEQRSIIIQEIDKDVQNGELQSGYSGRYQSSFLIRAYRSYQDLKDLLENSGIVYEVKNSGIYVLDVISNRFHYLLAYEYLRENKMYKITVLSTDCL